MVKINLLPIRQILRGKQLRQFAFIAAIILVSTLAVMGISYALLEWSKAGLENERAESQARLNKLLEENKKIDLLRRQLEQLERQVETIKNLTRTRISPAPFMVALSLALPDEVWLQSISKSGKGFSLDGVGVDNTVVVKFVENLQNIRQNFTPKDPFLPGYRADKKAADTKGQAPATAKAKKPAEAKEKGFFADVKLLQIVASSGAGGLGTVSFKITGSLQ